MSVVCLDTCVLTWAIQALHEAAGTALPIKLDSKWDAAEKARQKELRVRALGLMDALQAAGDTAALPSVVVGEILCAVPKARHVEVRGSFGKRFVVYPYDGLAAVEYGRLWILRHEDGVVQDLKAAQRPRSAIKADLMIVATALRWKAHHIYTHDRDVGKLAVGEQVNVKEMPPKPQVQVVLPVPGLNPKPTKGP